jgi:hypothetical protein
MRAIAFGFFLAFCISAAQAEQSPDEKRLKACQNTGTSCVLRCKDDAACENSCRDDYAICKAGADSPYKTGAFIQSQRQQAQQHPPRPVMDAALQQWRQAQPQRPGPNTDPSAAVERVSPSGQSSQKDQRETMQEGNFKYRPPLTPQQIAHPSNWYEQYEVALSAFDADLVAVARARGKDATKTLDWLESAQQQRDANNINKTKPLIYPVR